MREDWLPEIVIDFEEWIDLRRQAEEDLIFNPRNAGDPPLELWAQDSTYAIVLKDRARAPNLAAVRELSIGVWNEAGFPTSGEVWINEMRLSAPLRDAGMASHVALDIEASDVWTTRLTVSSRGALFRQLSESPTFQGDRVISLGSTFNLDRMAPADWGVEIPVTVTHVRSDQDPRFLTGSDIRTANGSESEGARVTEDTRRCGVSEAYTGRESCHRSSARRLGSAGRLLHGKFDHDYFRGVGVGRRWALGIWSGRGEA